MPPSTEPGSASGQTAPASEQTGQATGRDRRNGAAAAHLGRSGPRSRMGCTTCKQRRVRCDEAHPVCGHCSRLQLHCYYKPRPQKYRQQHRETQPASSGQSAFPRHSSVLAEPSVAADSANTNGSGLGVGSWRLPRPNGSPSVNAGQTSNGFIAGSPFGAFPRSGYATPDGYRSGVPPWTLARTVDFNDIFSELGTSWAGELSCILPEVASPSAPFSQNPAVDELDTAHGFLSVNDHGACEAGQAPLAVTSRSMASPVGDQQDRLAPDGEAPASLSGSREGPASNLGEDPTRLFQLFKKIHQPPAAILIGGFERWRRLQQYLCKLSEHSRAVHNSLLCVIELLMIEETAQEQGQNRETCMKRIFERHALACHEIERKLARHTGLRSKTRECLLAATFLLGWFEVIRDQDMQSSLFPRRLADAVITNHASWNRYSQQLLSWLNTLDSKATHLGREHLLTPDSLRVVSGYHTEITSSLQHGVDGHENDSDDSEQSNLETSPGESHFSPIDTVATSPHLGLGQVKQAMLHTILQPALGWYLTSQSYCRRISAHDKHHRRRFTSDDEFEVITACKQLETELFELWEYRPVVLTMPLEQLMAVVSPDIAMRLDEIFSTYLASFWILFVYLHRVSWWHLPHSALARRALAEVWRHMKRAYGEEVNGPLRKVIHPSLLWPLFLFGSECQTDEQRTWAIEQLEALGEAKAVLQSDEMDAETLPPFKLSLGATRNASRAAALLRELIKEQDAKQQRVDDRELSMKMFGCYFSIV